MTGALASGALLLCAAGAAQADTVTFDDPAGVAQSFVATSPIVDQGLVFTYSDGLGYIWNGVEDPSEGNGTYNYIYGFGSGLTITRQGGGAFDLNSADFTLSWYTLALGNVGFDPLTSLLSDTITVTGQTGGGPVIQNLTLGQGYQTYNLGLTGVTSVQVTANASGTGYWGMDNLQGRNFGAVPEPAAWTLMLVGFGGLGASLRMARRRSAKAAA